MRRRRARAWSTAATSSRASPRPTSSWPPSRRPASPADRAVMVGDTVYDVRAARPPASRASRCSAGGIGEQRAAAGGARRPCTATARELLAGLDDSPIGARCSGQLSSGGEQVAVLGDPRRARRRLVNTRSSGARAGLDLVPRHRRRHGRPLAGAQASRRVTVVLAALFCDQSTSTLPGRSALVIRCTTRSGCAASNRCASVLGVRRCLLAGAQAVGARVQLQALAAAGLGEHLAPSASSSGAQQQRHLAALDDRRRAGPGRGRAPAGPAVAAPPPRPATCGCAARARRGWRSTPGRRASRRRCTRWSRGPWSSPGEGSTSMRTQSGVPRGAFFSKNACPSTPSG